MKPGSLKGVAGRVKGYTPQIIYHDRGVIVVNKPPGLVTQTSKTLKNGAHRDAYSIFLDEVKTQLNLHTRPLHVHRLDKATTGALVLGRSPTLAKDLCKQFAERSVDKSYLALVHWHRHEVSGATGQVHVHLCMEDGRIDIARSMDDAGKLSVTSWEVAATSTILPLALLRLDLHTGLKHQLRVVLARYFQAPILGDSLYANPLPRDNTQGKIHGIPSDRLFLHSSSISIWRHAPSGRRRRLTVFAPLPEDFLNVCERAGLKVDGNALEARGGVLVDGEEVRDGLAIEGTGTVGLTKVPLHRSE